MKEFNYTGDNLLLLKQLNAGSNILFRASEFEELATIMLWGTDRGGYPPKYWENTGILYEDVIFATTEEDIIAAEKDPNRSSSFKKFDIIDNPILILYDISGFNKIADRQWLFLDPNNKKKYLLDIVKIQK